MTDVSGLRDAVVDATRTDTRDDALARISKGGLLLAFNDRAPAHMRISGAGEVRLQVDPVKALLTSKDTAYAEASFARAVAAIGQEISKPREKYGRLTASDYAKAPIFTTTSPEGHLTFSAGRGSLLVDEPVASLAEQALIRLANLLPSSADDADLEQRVLALRRPSARAVFEIAQVARRLEGLTMNLVGQSVRGEPVHSVVTEDQAEFLDEVLESQQTDVTRHVYQGRLDGMRYRRRMFYLETEGGVEVSGVVDEGLVEAVNQLLNHEVTAVVERVVRENRAGVAQRPTYRLVELSAQSQF